MKVCMYLKSILVMSVFMFGAAFADQNESGSKGEKEGPPPHHHHPKMTDAQKACFTANGLVAPGEGAWPKDRPDEATMGKVHACLEKNGFHGPRPPKPGPADLPPPAAGGGSNVQKSGSGSAADSED